MKEPKKDEIKVYYVTTCQLSKDGSKVFARDETKVIKLSDFEKYKAENEKVHIIEVNDYKDYIGRLVKQLAKKEKEIKEHVFMIKQYYYESMVGCFLFGAIAIIFAIGIIYNCA